jgi:putative LysE/RhtB family amino acid efflux pump
MAASLPPDSNPRQPTWDDLTMSSLLVGYGLGLMVAAQIGPMSLFLIRCTLRGGLLLGLAVGAGIAVIDTLYAAAGAAGAAPVLAIDSVRTIFGLAGAAVLIGLGARTLWSAWRVRLGAETDDEVATPRRAFLTALAGTASNPLTIASWAALFAAASVAGAAQSSAGAVLLVLGVGLGSITSVALLAFGVSLARERVGERLVRLADGGVGLGLIGFGGVLGYRALK